MEIKIGSLEKYDKSDLIRNGVVRGGELNRRHESITEVKMGKCRRTRVVQTSQNSRI